MPGLDSRACSCSSWRSREMFAGMSTLICLVGLYISVSGGMIAFNKYLMHEGRFPFSVPLVLMHSGFSSICALLLFLVKPSLFPSLSGSERISIDRDLILKNALPIALLFSVQLVLSNTAYLHSSMAFLQMMKEANLVLVYVFSLIAATETFSWNKMKVIVLIMAATTLTIHGEISFSWTGFILQSSGQLFESLKIVLQCLLLSNAGRKLDPLTFVLLVMPLCFVALGSVLLGMTFLHPMESFKIPQWSVIVAWWPVLAANASLAFALNLSIAVLMKHSSAVGFIMAGIAKDCFIVLIGAIALSEHISRVQACGFAAQLGFIWIWSLMKLHPEKFEGGVLAGLQILVAPKLEEKCLLAPEPWAEAALTSTYGAQEISLNGTSTYGAQDKSPDSKC